MNRRCFLSATLAGPPAFNALARQAVAESAGNVQKKVLMKAGHQGRSSDDDLRVLAALGVTHICSALPSRPFDRNWSLDGLLRLRERVERFGIQLDMVPLPLSSSPIGRAENPHIMLGKSPERDREMDHICRMIRNVAKAGIPAV